MQWTSGLCSAASWSASPRLMCSNCTLADRPSPTDQAALSRSGWVNAAHLIMATLCAKYSKERYQYHKNVETNAMKFNKETQRIEYDTMTIN